MRKRALSVQMAQLQQLFCCEKPLCLGLLNQPQDLPRLALPPDQVHLLQNTYSLMKRQLHKLACTIIALCLGLLIELHFLRMFVLPPHQVQVLQSQQSICLQAEIVKPA